MCNSTLISIATILVLLAGCDREEPQPPKVPDAAPSPLSGVENVELNSRDSEIVKEGEQVILYRRGLDLLVQSRFEQAISYFDQAIELDSEFALAHYGRGQAYDNLGDTEAAMKDLNRAIEIDPSDPNPYYSRGVLLAAQGDYELAIADYDRALEIGPDDADAFAARGAAWHSRGEFDKAIADYSQALELQPDHADAYFGRGVIRHDQEDYDACISDLSESIRLNPEGRPAAYLVRADAYRKLGKDDAAEADESTARGLSP